MAQWYYAKGNQQVGPVDESAIRELVARGEIAGTDLVWCDGMAQWEPASSQFGPPAAATAAPVLGGSADPGGPATEWYYSKGGQRLGPVDDATLRSLAAQGVVTPGDLVWRDGMPNWEPAAQVLQLGGGMPAGMPGGMSGGMPVGYAPVPLEDGGTQKTLSILAIVFGCLGVICCPVVFGVAGIVCGAIAVNKPGPHKGLAKIGLTVGIVGTVLGCALGAAIRLMK